MATREHRRAPLGWTAPDVSGLTGIPVRTLQVWRKSGFFVPALPAEWTDHPQGELYGLCDAIALVVMRTLLDEGLDREVVARVGEELPGTEETLIDYRLVAKRTDPWWVLVPLRLDLLSAPADGVSRFIDEAMLQERGSLPEDEFIWIEAGQERLAAAIPLSRIASRLCESADHWRRRRRIPVRSWPPWM